MLGVSIGEYVKCTSRRRGCYQVVGNRPGRTSRKDSTSKTVLVGHYPHLYI